ncbi:MAG: flagellar biosynthesis protein FlhF [Planctomycetota bacterium]|nr:flagellar biosynthesis protein FlhF [Planctomycetota bacterium]
MGVKTYQAYTMAEALAAAKRDLGADAVILETRTFKRGGLLGIGRKTIFELTATTADRAELSHARRSGRLPRPVSKAASEAYGRSIGRASASSTLAKVSAEKSRESQGIRARRLAQTTVETHKHLQQSSDVARFRSSDEKASPSESPIAEVAGRRPEKAKESREPRSRLEPAEAPSSPPRDRHVSKLPPPPRHADEGLRAPVARRFILTPADAAPSNAATAVAHPLQQQEIAVPARSTRREPVELFVEDDPSRVERAAGPTSATMQRELDAIKTMVGQVLQRQTLGRATVTRPMPAKLFDIYMALLAQDLSEELADQLISDVRDELDGEACEDESAVRERVLHHLAALIGVAEPDFAPRRADQRPLTIAVIGPTGVGKTTTLAKLAALFKLRHHRKVGLVTCDTYRIAAVDQLRTYANIIGLPLKIALTPSEMAQAVHSLGDCEVIFIDTAGRGQNDHARIDELRRCLAAAEPHEVHLVLSSTASEGVLLREAEAFDEVGPDRIVLTKLDEAVSFGVLINVIHKVGKKLSFITTGQEVPEHIEVGQARRLAELVLGAEVHK